MQVSLIDTKGQVSSPSDCYMVQIQLGNGEFLLVSAEGRDGIRVIGRLLQPVTGSEAKVEVKTVRLESGKPVVVTKA